MSHRDAVLLGRLYALRESLDAVIDVLEPAAEPPATSCQHPMAQRKYVGETMGAGAEFHCQQCGETVAEMNHQILDRIVRPSTPGA